MLNENQLKRNNLAKLFNKLIVYFILGDECHKIFVSSLGKRGGSVLED